MRTFAKLVFVIIMAITFATCQNTEVKDSETDQIVENRSKHYDLVVGQIIDNKPVISTDLAKLKTRMEETINHAPNLDVSLNEIYISKEDGIYYLVGRDTVNRSTSKVKLVLDDGKLYEAKYHLE